MRRLWTIIGVEDVARSLRWYQSLLGLALAPPAALLATLELGPGENANCGGRYAK